MVIATYKDKYGTVQARSSTDSLGNTTYKDRYGAVQARSHTDSLGNSTGVVEYTTTTADETNRTVSVPRYRGIENPFGHVWKNVIDVIFNGTENNVYICEDYNNFGSISSEINNRALYKLQQYSIPTTEGYVTKLADTNSGELFPAEL